MQVMSGDSILSKYVAAAAAAGLLVVDTVDRVTDEEVVTDMSSYAGQNSPASVKIQNVGS